MFGFWIALAVFVLCVGTGLANAVVRGLGTWRQLKRTRTALGEELARITSATAEIEKQLAAASASQDSLKQALARLTESRAQLMLQLAAVGEAQWVVRRLLPFLPR